MFSKVSIIENIVFEIAILANQGGGNLMNYFNHLSENLDQVDGSFCWLLDSNETLVLLEGSWLSRLFLCR